MQHPLNGVVVVAVGVVEPCGHVVGKLLHATARERNVELMLPTATMRVSSELHSAAVKSSTQLSSGSFDLIMQHPVAASVVVVVVLDVVVMVVVVPEEVAVVVVAVVELWGQEAGRLLQAVSAANSVALSRLPVANNLDASASHLISVHLSMQLSSLRNTMMQQPAGCVVVVLVVLNVVVVVAVVVVAVVVVAVVVLAVTVVSVVVLTVDVVVVVCVSVVVLTVVVVDVPVTVVVPPFHLLQSCSSSSSPSGQSGGSK